MFFEIINIQIPPLDWSGCWEKKKDKIEDMSTGDLFDCRKERARKIQILARF